MYWMMLASKPGGDENLCTRPTRNSDPRTSFRMGNESISPG